MKLALIFGLFVAIANCITIANYTFDATNGQWNSSRLPESIGLPRNWNWGNPSWSGGCFSGNCWATGNLTTQDVSSYQILMVESPAISFASATLPGLQRVSFRLWLNAFVASSNPTSALTLVYSTDNRNSWKPVGTANSTTGTNWFNSIPTFAFSGTSVSGFPGWTGVAGWRQCTQQLPQLAGLSNVYFRFIFVSNLAKLTSGAVIDNFVVETISSQPAPYCAVIQTPTYNQASVRPDRIFSWTLNATDPNLANVDGFYFSFGTNAQGNNTVSNAVLPVSQLSSPMPFPPTWPVGTIVYWKAVPFTQSRTIPSSSCLIWQFIVGNLPSVSSFPYIQNFDSAPANGSLPTEWRNDLFDTSSSGGNTVDWTVSTTSSFGASVDHTSGTGKFASVDDSLITNQALPVVMYSPIFNSSLMGAIQVQFWVQNRASAEAGQISVLRVDCGTFNSIWTLDLAIVNTTLTKWTKVSFSVPRASFPNWFVLRFRVFGTSTFISDLSFDDFVVFDSTVAPQPLLSSSISINQYQISWPEVIGATAYTVNIGTDGSGTSTPTNLIRTNVTSTVFVFPALQTSYYVQIIPRSASGAASNNPIVSVSLNRITSFPYSENFDNVASGQISNSPFWFNDKFDGSLKDFKIVNSTSQGARQDHTSGNGTFLSLDNTATTGGLTTTIYSPVFSLASLTIPVLSFWLQNRRFPGSNDLSQLRIDLFNPDLNTWASIPSTSSFLVPQQQIYSWTQFRLNLTPYKTYIAMRIIGIDGNSFESDLSIDDLQIRDANADTISCVSVTIATLQQGFSLSFDYQLLYPATQAYLYVGTNGNGNTLPTSILNGVVHNPSVPLVLPSGTFYFSLVPGISTTKMASGCTISQISIQNVQNNPFIETFDLASAQWKNDNFDSGDSFQFSTAAPFGANNDHSTRDGKFAFLPDFDNGFVGNSSLLSPRIQLSNFTTPAISFWYQNQNPLVSSGFVSILALDIFDGNSSTWALLNTFSSITTKWTNVTVTIPTIYKSSNFVVLRFRGQKTSEAASDISIDDIVVFDQNTPSCSSSDFSIVSVANTLTLFVPSFNPSFAYFANITVGSTSISNFITNATFSTQIPMNLISFPTTNVNVRITITRAAASVSCQLSYSLPLVNTFPYVENFNNPQTSLWHNDPNDGGQHWNFATWMQYGAQNEHSSYDSDRNSVGMFVSVDNSVPILNDVNFVSPFFALNTLTNPELSFWFMNSVTSEFYLGSQLHIDVITNEITTPTWRLDFYPAFIVSTSDWTKVIVDLSALKQISGVTFFAVRLRVIADSASSQSDVSIDDFTVFDANGANTGTSACVTASSFSFSANQIRWTDTLGSRNWMVSIGSTRNLSVWDVVNSATVSDTKISVALVPGSYRISITPRSDNGVSSCVFTRNFTISAISANPAIIETFDDSNSGFGSYSSNVVSQSKTFSYATSRPWGAQSDHTTGDGYFVFVNDYAPSSNNMAQLFSPWYNVSTLASPQISFWFANIAFLPQIASELYLDVTTNGKNWTNIYYYNDITEVWTQAQVDLNSAVSSLSGWSPRNSSIMLRFRVWSGGEFESDFCLDDIVISETSQTLLCPSQVTLSVQASLIYAVWPTVVSAYAYTIYIQNNAGTTLTSVNSSYTDVGIDVVPGTYKAVVVPFRYSGTVASGCNSTTSIVVSASSTVPNNKNFDDGLFGGWTNDYNNQNNFKVVETSNWGATSDHTSGTGKFIVLDDSISTTSSNSFLSSWFDYKSIAGGLTFSFWYQNSRTAGTPVGQIFLEIQTLSSSTSGAAPQNWQLVRSWSSAVLQWSRQSVNLDQWSGSVFRLRFRVVSSSSGRADFCLDDISMSLEQVTVSAPITTSSSSSSASVVGIVIGIIVCVCAIAICAFIVYRFIWKKRKGYDFTKTLGGQSRRNTIVEMEGLGSGSRRPTVTNIDEALQGSEDQPGTSLEPTDRKRALTVFEMTSGQVSKRNQQ